MRQLACSKLSVNIFMLIRIKNCFQQRISFSGYSADARIIYSRTLVKASRESSDLNVSASEIRFPKSIPVMRGSSSACFRRKFRRCPRRGSLGKSAAIVYLRYRDLARPKGSYYGNITHIFIVEGHTFGSLQRPSFTRPHVAHLMIDPAISSIPICIVRQVSTPFGIVRFGTTAS